MRPSFRRRKKLKERSFFLPPGRVETSAGRVVALPEFRIDISYPSHSSRKHASGRPPFMLKIGDSFSRTSRLPSPPFLSPP